MIYETKGLTLEEVDELYNEISSARKSVGWEPTVKWTEEKGTHSPLFSDNHG
jgi:hypothetical protein